MSTLTPEAKSKLAKTIRSLRERLLRDLHDRADSVYRLAVKDIAKAGLPEDRHIRRQRLDAWIDEQARSSRAKDESLDQARERHRLRVSTHFACGCALWETLELAPGSGRG